MEGMHLSASISRSEILAQLLQLVGFRHSYNWR